MNVNWFVLENMAINLIYKNKSKVIKIKYMKHKEKKKI
jgi:hypothetical protein